MKLLNTHNDLKAMLRQGSRIGRQFYIINYKNYIATIYGNFRKNQGNKPKRNNQ